MGNPRYRNSINRLIKAILMCLFLVSVSIEPAEAQGIRITPKIKYQVIHKRLGPDLPSYDAAVVQLKDSMMSFIVPQGYTSRAIPSKNQIIFASAETGGSFILKFLTQLDIGKMTLKERFSTLEESVSKSGSDIKKLSALILGKSSDALVFTLGNSESVKRARVFYTQFPFGDGACEITLRANEDVFERTRQDLDMLLMTAMVGDKGNPPEIPELGGSI